MKRIFTTLFLLYYRPALCLRDNHLLFKNKIERSMYKNIAYKNKMTTISEYKQSQSHGLFFNDEIREKVFSLPKTINDCEKYDICCQDNKFDSNENISIKVSGNKNIDCGDILRFYDIDYNKKITIILIRYKQFNTTKQITEILEINYNKKLRDILFGTISRDVLERYVNFIKSIKPGTVPSDVKKTYKDYKKNLQNEFNMGIKISPKVDSKNQRRVQCTMTKIDELFANHPEFIMSKNSESIIRGIKITNVIKSGKRIRHSKSHSKLS